MVNKEKGEGRVGRDEVRKVPGTGSHQALEVIDRLDVMYKRELVRMTPTFLT